MLPAPVSAHGKTLVAEPTPLGLIGLAIGCAALTPIAFGVRLSSAAFQTAAIFCLLFGGGCQLLSGLFNFLNRNVYGGTLLTAFSFNWFLNGWVLSAVAAGQAPDHTVFLATDTTFLVIFAVFTYGFGFFSKLLFVFLLDIDLLFVFKLANALTETTTFNLPIAVCTVALGLLALWIAFAMLINPTAGRPLFKIGGPLFTPRPAASFDFSVRRALFDALYDRFVHHGFAPLPLTDLQAALSAKAPQRNVLPDLDYLAEQGAVLLTRPTADAPPQTARLTAAGIDVYERTVLGKHQGQ